ncbi:serine/threonine-protein kinase ULK4 isoform X2 [Oreochromis niloticus]|uniref:serine/threonine-protein kinase ULK4 isoform X2 n=1 Tax=Oreochromis niloticus TaxID=8128 RepID=UPI000DF43CDB|nr:serine/threonine-protein kinase ULK4 isoform X2 [Oreochromis niloticus]
MENFILYEELGAGCNSVVYKGRRKGNLNYVAIKCTDKTKRPEITNHVRLTQDLDHPNIANFYEWYETSNHLWLVVELCTGGSLESVIALDGSLSQDGVRRFGWHLVKGLKHIHELGIIFSDLTPAKILLDGSGILKFGSFCLSKAEGETLQDFLTLFSASEEIEEGDSNQNTDNLKKRLQGSTAYSAPEVLEGSETNMNSDLWSLGCILYYMYTGKPPFCSDNYTELREMILNEEPPPPRQTVVSAGPPCQDFQSLLKGLLNKNPERRMNWPQLLAHPFWTQIIKEEEDAEEGEEKNEENEEEESVCKEVVSCSLRPCDRRTDSQNSVKHTSSGALSQSLTLNSEVLRERRREGEPEDDPKLTGSQQMCRTLQSNKSFTLDNVSDLKPKSGLDEDSTEAIFLLSSRANSVRNCSSSDCPNQNIAPQVTLTTSNCTDTTCCVKDLLHTEFDLTVTPVIDNPKILKNTPVRYDPKTLCVPAYSGEKLQSLSDEEWTVFLSQLCSSIEEQSHSTSTATRSKLNLLCYLCCVVGHTVIANRLINSRLLLVLVHLLRQAPNWDIRSKVLRVMGLLALHCRDLGVDSPVSEAVSTLTDLLRDNLRNSKIKRLLLPPLAEFLYLISSQEKKRGSPEGLWFVPAAAYTGLMRSLREGFLAGLQSIKHTDSGCSPVGSLVSWPAQPGECWNRPFYRFPEGCQRIHYAVVQHSLLVDDTAVHHMAAKAIENISTVLSGPSHHLVTTEIGSALWYLFTHSTVEAVRVTAISSLSRLTRVVPAIFLSVIDTCGPVAILEGLVGTGARVQQHLLTAVAAALLTSCTQTHRVTQNRDLVLKVLRCLESPSTITRAKAILLLLLLIQDNTHTLLYCCQNRLVIYLERDLRKATPLRENPSQSGYLSQCLDLLIAYLSSTAPVIMEDVLCALRGVIGRRHPTTPQSKQLKQTLPTLSIVLDLVSSQVFRSHIVTGQFLAQIGLLLNFIASVESNETNLASAMGTAICEDLIRTSLSIVEVLSQHHALISPHHSDVVDAILPPLTTMAFSKNVEWSVFVLRVLSELSLILLVQDGVDTELKEERTEENKERSEKEGKAAEERGDGLSCITESLLSRLIKRSRILPMVFQLIMANRSNVTNGIVQNAVVLLCNLSEGTIQEQQPLYQQGLIEVVVCTLSEAALAHLDREEHAGRKVGHVVLQALLELLHNVLKQTSVVVRSALQSQRLSCPAAETEAAEKLLLANRPLSQLSTHLIHMLSAENQEIWEESIHCLSLLVQLYCGEGPDCLSPSCLRSFSHVLRTRMHTETPRTQRTALKIIKRLVQATDRSDWSECPEGAELMSLLHDMTTSNRYHTDVTGLAADILQEISES